MLHCAAHIRMQMRCAANIREQARCVAQYTPECKLHTLECKPAELHMPECKHDALHIPECKLHISECKRAALQISEYKRTALHISECQRAAPHNNIRVQARCAANIRNKLIYIFVEQSKTDQTRIGYTVVLAGSTTSSLCPTSWFNIKQTKKKSERSFRGNTSSTTLKLLPRTKAISKTAKLFADRMARKYWRDP